MALNLSTLTGATSGDVLAEALTTADFLENVPVLRNLARGSQKGGDAKQDVALNQPRSLPLIKNPAGNLGGYLYIPDVTGNYATGPSVTIGSNETWEAEVDMVITQFGNYIAPMGGGLWSSGFGFIIRADGAYRAFSKGASTPYANNPIIPFGSPTNIKYGFNGTLLYVDINGQRAVDSGGGQLGSITHPLQLNQQTSLTHQGNYAIQKAKLTVNSAVVFDCDFNGSTSIRHGDQKWKAAVGGVVSIAKPELITNGNFDTDTAWTKGTGWTIADGVATLDNTSGSGSSSLNSSVFSVTSGTEYKIVVEVISTSSGLRLYDADGVLSYNLNVGRNVFYKEATSSSYSVTPLGLAGSSGSIDNISVTEVLPDSGRDPITVVKKDILRFDGANDGLNGLFNQTFTGGYMFAAFSVLGDGGESGARIFTGNSTGAFDYQTDGFALRRYNESSQIQVRWNGGSEVTHSDVFNGARGDFLLESPLRAGDQNSKINNADADDGACVLPNPVSSEEFNIGTNSAGDVNACLDLEFLALFSADSVPDEATATKIRDYINKRNQIYLRHDTDGYFFFDPQKANEGKVAFWNGRIAGSDNGDSDRYLTQTTGNDQPVSDGYVVTFADNTDHLEIPQVTQAGWQVVGTSLGTFAYRVNNTAVTELNLLGNLGSIYTRQAGDLYGIILLPESATGRDIEEAKNLLIDRGASEIPSGIIRNFWRFRAEIVNFKAVDMSSVTFAREAWYGCSSLSQFEVTEIPACNDFFSAWHSCSSLTSFPADAKLGTEANNVNFSSSWRSSGLTSFSTPLPTATTASRTWQQCTSLTSFSTELPTATRVDYAWYDCSSLSDFTTTDIKNCTNFISSWQNCSALQSFPAGAKLGTEASSGVTFDSAWRSSGLTSFSTPLPTAANVSSAWYGCTSLESFSSSLPTASNVSFSWYNSAISSFSSELPLATTVLQTWSFCGFLTSFDTPLPSATNVYAAWRNCTALTDFSADVFANWNPSSISSGVFHLAWDGCPLTAKSVENILTSIDASNQHGTDDGTSTGNPLGDSGIDIDYNGDPLSAATNSAVTSLKAKGWSIIVNNVTL